MRSTLALMLTLAAGAAHAACLTVEAHNVRPQQGTLMVAAYVDAGSFGKTAAAQVRVPAGEAVTRFELCGLPEGMTEVALMGYQDLDGDGRMARNLLGMPTEPWGSSGTPGAFGPAWDTGKVKPVQGQPVVMKLSV